MSRQIIWTKPLNSHGLVLRYGGTESSQLSLWRSTKVSWVWNVI